VPRIAINEDRCKGCGLCVSACPRHAIEMAKEINRHGYFFARMTDKELCIGCKLCAMACPDTGIEVYGKKRKGTK
jgi:2-oxoglutarate ferredoxin oxidoreductase subunit delta